MTNKRLGLLVAVTACALVGLPISVDLVVGGPSRFFGYVAADTFYYLVVGRNIGLHGIVAYDGTHLSNGFQPAWQALVALPYALRLLSVPTVAEILAVVLLSLFCVTASVWLLGRALVRSDGSLHPAFVALPMGAYAIFVSPAWLTLSLEQLKQQNRFEGSEPLYGTLWSYVNGMESPLLLLTFAGLFWLWARGKVSEAPGIFGALLALLTLARLDHLFIACPLLVLAAAKVRRSRRQLLTLIANFVVPLALYLAANRLFFGGFVPFSGVLKSTFPQFSTEALENAQNVLRSAGSTARRPAIFVYWRVLQLLVPALFALVSPLLLLQVRRRAGKPGLHFVNVNTGPFLAAVSVGVFCLVTYDFLFVRLFAQGSWYVPVPVLFVSLVVFTAIDRWPVNLRLGGTLALSGLFFVAGLAFFLRLHRHPDYHARYYEFYANEAPKLRAAFGAAPPRLLEFDDGIVAWATNFPSMSASGLGLDAAAARALERGELTQLAAARGHNNLTSLVYFDANGLRRNPTPAELASWANRISPLGSMSPWRLNETWRSTTSHFIILGFSAAHTSPSRQP